MRNFGCGRRLRRRHYSRLACSPLPLCLLHPLRNLLRRHPHDPQETFRLTPAAPWKAQSSWSSASLPASPSPPAPPPRPKTPRLPLPNRWRRKSPPRRPSGDFSAREPGPPIPNARPLPRAQGSSPTRSPLNPTHNAPKISNRVLAQSRQKRNIQPLARGTPAPTFRSDRRRTSPQSDSRLSDPANAQPFPHRLTGACGHP